MKKRPSFNEQLKKFKNNLSILLQKSFKRLYIVTKKVNAKFWEIDHFYPSHKIKIIGIVGTEGKTTTGTILFDILSDAQIPVTQITTKQIRNSPIKKNNGVTLFGRVGSEDQYEINKIGLSYRSLQKSISKIVRRGSKYLILEISSHELEHYWLSGIKLHSLLFTNIAHEYQDYHSTFDEHIKAKSELLSLVDKKSGFVMLNKEHKSFEYLKRRSIENNLNFYTYGLYEGAELYARDIVQEPGLISFIANQKGVNFPITLKLPGEFSIYNTLLIIKVALKLKLTPKQIAQSMGSDRPIEGRWEILNSNPFLVVADFAHTPSSIALILEYAKKITTKGKVHLVVGATGKKDIDKRTMIGRAAGEFADYIYLTAEDPKGENIENINRQIVIGIKEENRLKDKNIVTIPDRGEAIRFALENCKRGDTLIVTGKAHKKKINLDGKVETEWGDQNVIRHHLNRLKSTRKEVFI